jgi:drug/metabolite transporter (DMT)-like permease
VQAELLAALAALSWAVGSLFSAAASSRMGAFAFTRWRLFFALTLLWALALFTGQWRSLDSSSVALLALSGLIGIFIGDTALFACMNRLGPRRSGVLFATHALFSTLLAWLFLGETLWGWTLVGGSLLVSGVMVAIVWGRRESETHAWENTQGSLWTGVVLGLVAAVCQSVATLMIKPLMASGCGRGVRVCSAHNGQFFGAFGTAVGRVLRWPKLQNPLNPQTLFNTGPVRPWPWPWA